MATLSTLTPPLAVWTAIRLPLLSLARRDPDLAERRRARIASESQILRVEASRCGGCRQPADDLYVVTDGTTNVALCRGCLDAVGSKALTRKANHLDHEYQRLQRRVTTGAGR